MRKSALRLTSVALAAGFAGIALFSSGCGNPQEKADSALAAKIAQADKDRADASNPKQLSVVQGQYDSAATGATTDADVSLQMKVLSKSRDAQMRYERAMGMMGELRNKELAIIRSITAINQLASQIQGSQAYVDSLKKFDPAAQLAVLKTQEDSIQGPGASYAQPVGSAEHPDAKVLIPTIEKLKTDIDELTAKIAKTKEAIEALHKQSAQAIDQNETLSRKLESETGDALVVDSTQAAKLRQDAANFDAQADTLHAAQARMEADLATAQAQKGAVDGTSDTVLGQIKRLEAAWGIIQDQLNAEKQLQQKLIAGSPDANSKEASSMVAHAVELAAQLKACDALRGEVEKELTGAIAQFKLAAADANKVYVNVQHLIAEKPEDADKPIWKQELETMYPGYFTLSQATAMGSLASVKASKATIDKRMEEMFEGYLVGHDVTSEWVKNMKVSVDAPAQNTAVSGLSALLTNENTGMDMPKEVSDLPRVTQDEFQPELNDVNKAFTDSLEVYKPSGIDTTLASASRHTAGMLGIAVTNRQWAQFDLLIDLPQDAKAHIQAAVEAEGELPATPVVQSTPLSSGGTTQPAGR